MSISDLTSEQLSFITRVLQHTANGSAYSYNNISNKSYLGAKGHTTLLPSDYEDVEFLKSYAPHFKPYLSKEDRRKQLYQFLKYNPTLAMDHPYTYGYILAWMDGNFPPEIQKRINENTIEPEF